MVLTYNDNEKLEAVITWSDGKMEVGEGKYNAAGTITNPDETKYKEYNTLTNVYWKATLTNEYYSGILR